MAKINLAISICEKIVINVKSVTLLQSFGNSQKSTYLRYSLNSRNIKSSYCLDVHFGLIYETLTEFFFLNFIIDGTTYNRSKYADKTKYCKYKKNYFNADKKIGIVLRADLDISHKNQHNK